MSINPSRSCNQRCGWMIAIQWRGNRISFEKSNLTPFFPLFTLPISLKTGSRPLSNNYDVQPPDYTCKRYLNSQREYIPPRSYISLSHISQGLCNNVLNFSTSKALSFHYAPLIFRQRALSVVCKAKGRAPMNCFKEIYIMPSDWVSILSWIFSRHGCLSYQRKEKRTSVERNGLSKEGTELSC